MHNVFDACRSIMRAGGRGLGLGNQEFFDPVKWHLTDIKNHNGQGRINHRCIGSFMYKSPLGPKNNPPLALVMDPPPLITKRIRNQEDTVRYIKGTLQYIKFCFDAHFEILEELSM
jgi:hypothetical protein